MKSSFRRCIREYVRDARLTKYSPFEHTARRPESMLWTPFITPFTRVAEAKVARIEG